MSSIASLRNLSGLKPSKLGPLSVCVCDLDWFKQVNDKYGHAMGDRVLAAFGRLLRDGLRQSDIAARRWRR